MARFYHASHWKPNLSFETPILINLDHVEDIQPNVKGGTIFTMASHRTDEERWHHISDSFDEVCARISEGKLFR